MIFSRIFKRTTDDKGSNKYHAKKTMIDGIIFDSKKEADYYCTLRMKEKATDPKERVENIERQIPFELQPQFKHKGSTIRAIKYLADFVVTYADGRKEVVDTKGFRTETYRLKKKMLLYKYPDIDFKEI